MARKHKPEEIIGKLREAELVLAQGGTVADVCHRTGVTGQSYYRWRKEYGRQLDHRRSISSRVVSGEWSINLRRRSGRSQILRCT